MKQISSFSLLTLTGLLLMGCGTGTPADTTKPTVSLVAAPATITSTGNVTLTATASDNQGVTQVNFYQGNQIVCEDRVAPFTCETPVSSADNGTVTYRAMAFDAAGNTAEATASVTVNIPVADTVAPTLNVNVVQNSPTSYTVNADAADDRGVTKVEFYADGKLVATDTTAPYSAALTYTKTDNGQHTVMVKAFDADGNVTTQSQTFTVNVDGTSPAVFLQATPAVITEPGEITVTATALDDQGVVRVEFFDNGVLVATDTTAPYTLVRSYTAADNGTHTLVARAFDAQGNVGEASTTVTVNADAIKPTVSVSAQPNPLTLPGAATFNATATDDRVVSKVEFYDNGVLVATDAEAPYTASKTYSFADNGVHTITVKAFDAQGNVGESSTELSVAITDANEPNNSVATATPLSIGAPQNATIAGMGRDYDYFRFDAAAGDMLKLNVLSVSVNPASTLDPYVMILMPDGKTVLEKDDDSGAGLESEIRFNVPVSGTYTVIVTSFKIQDDSQATDDLATNTYQIALTRR